MIGDFKEVSEDDLSRVFLNKTSIGNDGNIGNSA